MTDPYSTKTTQSSSSHRVASILAFIVGILSIIAGGMVMRGWRPGYSIVTWLPIYNFIIGLLTLAPAILIWTKNRYALTASLAILSVHAIVLLSLLTFLRSDIALQSIGAMTFRVVIWIIILVLLRPWQQS